MARVRILEWPEKLPSTAQECQTLFQYRELVLKLKQSEVAKLAGVGQSRISEIESGHVPRPEKWPSLLKGYRLEEPKEFYRLVINERKLRALRKKISETEPLLAMGTGSGEVTAMQGIEVQQRIAGGA